MTRNGLALFAEMPAGQVDADIVSYNAAISACENLALFAEMPAKRVDTDIVNYNAAISACEKGQLWRMAPGLSAEMLAKPAAWTRD